MQALILAAGKGKRLGEHTKHDTKCMVEVNGKKLIDYSLETLLKFDIKKIILVVGYQGHRVEEYIGNSYQGVPVEYVTNPDFDTTNNIYSLYLAKDKLTEDETIILESDLIFEEAVIRKIVECKTSENLALVEQFKSWMDGTVVEVNAQDEIKSFTPKQDYDYSRIETFYKTVNIYKFSSEFAKQYYNPFLEAYCQSAGHNEFYENVLKIIAFLDKSSIKVCKLEDGEKWYEIDDIQDLHNAETLFAKDLSKYQNRYGGYWRFPNLKDFCYLVNPYFPPPKMVEEYKYFFNTLVEEYPSGQNVQNLLAGKMFGIRPEHIMVGNGAAELISGLMSAFDDQKVGIIYPTFEEYPARCQNNIVKLVPDNPDFSYSIDQLKKWSQEVDSLLLINPDNPSGNFIPKAELLEVVEHFDQQNKTLIVDESFVDFSNENDQNSIIHNDILEKYQNLVIIKSISKSYGVPGIRLGVMATANQALYSHVRSRVSIWNINSFGEYFLQIYNKYANDYKLASKQIAAERDRFYLELQKVPYLRPVPSQANYFLCEITDKYTAKELTQQMMNKASILIKDCSGKPGFEGKEYVRIAVRDMSDNDFLVKNLQLL